MDNLYDEIEAERNKLTDLINKAKQENRPINDDEAILAQSQKLDELLAKFSSQRKAGKKKGRSGVER